jgi:hypothetical protein
MYKYTYTYLYLIIITITFVQVVGGRRFRMEPGSITVFL